MKITKQRVKEAFQELGMLAHPQTKPVLKFKARSFIENLLADLYDTTPEETPEETPEPPKKDNQ